MELSIVTWSRITTHSCWWKKNPLLIFPIRIFSRWGRKKSYTCIYWRNCLASEREMGESSGNKWKIYNTFPFSKIIHAGFKNMVKIRTINSSFSSSNQHQKAVESRNEIKRELEMEKREKYFVQSRELEGSSSYFKRI